MCDSDVCGGEGGGREGAREIACRPDNKHVKIKVNPVQSSKTKPNSVRSSAQIFKKNHPASKKKQKTKNPCPVPTF